MERELNIGYMRQLDGLRAIAAGMVLYSHLYPRSPLHDGIGWGYIGVRLFFVLSGFLITGILLDARPANDQGRPGILRAFYARRALRIFPIYYLSLAIVGVVLYPFDKLQMWSLITYSSNWFTVLHANSPNLTDQLIAGHFWSLAVEEQFYLFWPWLILYVPRKWILPSILTTIFVAPTLRMVLASQHYVQGVWIFNTVGCLDTLGAGSLLAYASRTRGRVATTRLAKWGGLASIPLFFLGFPTGLKWWPTHYILLFTLQDIFFACLFAWMIWSAAEGVGGIAGRLLASSAVVYLGRISYGIYIYHEFLRMGGPWLFRSAGLQYPVDGYLRSIGLTIASVAVASVSWYLIERPINGLKKWFPYRLAERA